MASAELIEMLAKAESKAVDGLLDLQTIEILVDLSRVAIVTENDVRTGLAITRKAKEYTKRLFQVQNLTVEQVDEYRIQEGIQVPEIDLWWSIILEETPYIFESFIFYMEKERPRDKKFYATRRYTKDGRPALKSVADDLQQLMARKFDFYGLSMPSRTGKSTICIFYLAWKSLRNPNSHNAMVGHAGTLVKGFYKELLNLITSEEYQFTKIYEHLHPNKVLLRDKSAEDYTITLDEPDRFATITCRGIDATWTGAVDVSADGLLYVDDLVRDRQHSLSPSRMEETFQEYLNKCVDRKQSGAQELMVGTLWNVLDPLERLHKQYGSDPRYKFKRMPALDDNDESNFDYEEHGFPSQYYIDMRERLDNAEWQAKYQQHPYVREGLLFPADELRYFNGNVGEEVKRTVAVCDPAFGGGDSLSMPICRETYDGRKRIIAWIYDKRTTKFTVPRIVDALARYGITELRIEKNNGGKFVEDLIKDEMKRKKVHSCKVTSVSAPNGMSKEDKIKGYSDYIKDNFEFLPAKKYVLDGEEPEFVRDEDYQRAMDVTSMFTSEGKNPTDDAPDSLSQLAILFEKLTNGTVEVVKNPFRSMM